MNKLWLGVAAIAGFTTALLIQQYFPDFASKLSIHQNERVGNHE